METQTTKMIVTSKKHTFPIMLPASYRKTEKQTVILFSFL